MRVLLWTRRLARAVCVGQGLGNKRQDLGPAAFLNRFTDTFECFDIYLASTGRHCP